MVPELSALGLVECRNCVAGTPKTRVSKSGKEICETCEDSLSQFWRRNIGALSTEEASVLEVRWEWIAVKRQILRKCLERAEQDVLITTTRTETDEVDGKPVTITHKTERRETRIYADLLRLAGETVNQIAKITGFDVDDPEVGDTVPRGKVHVERSDAGTVH
jgi:hypothetical protein